MGRKTEEKKKKKKQGLVERLVLAHNNRPGPVVRFLRENYGRISFVLVAVSLLVFLANFSVGRKMILLSYGEEQADGEVLYGSGSDDLYNMFFMSAVFTLLRAIMDYPLLALAKKLKVEEGNLPKFSDMGWQGMYYTTAWCTGMMLYSNADWGFCLDCLWDDMPHTLITNGFKWYYLLQTSFWIHQLFLMSVEFWRKDFWMYYLHHFITIGMLVGSYFLNLTRVGTAILVEQDFADIFLPIAKLFNYANAEPWATIFYVCFTVAWIPTRHYVYPKILESIWNLDIEKKGNGFYTKTTQNVFIVVMVIFQCLLILWLKDLLVGVYKAVKQALDGEGFAGEDHREVTGESDHDHKE